MYINIYIHIRTRTHIYKFCTLIHIIYAYTYIYVYIYIRIYIYVYINTHVCTYAGISNARVVCSPSASFCRHKFTKVISTIFLLHVCVPNITVTISVLRWVFAKAVINTFTKAVITAFTKSDHCFSDVTSAPLPTDSQN